MVDLNCSKPFKVSLVKLRVRTVNCCFDAVAAQITSTNGFKELVEFGSVVFKLHLDTRLFSREIFF